MNKKDKKQIMKKLEANLLELQKKVENVAWDQAKAKSNPYTIGRELFDEVESMIHSMIEKNEKLNSPIEDINMLMLGFMDEALECYIDIHEEEDTLANVAEYIKQK
jgi:phosphoglycerate-specific signal transduction histidine kinase